MLSFLEKIAGINEVQVVGVFRTGDLEAWHFLKLKRKKSRLDILESGTADDFESLKSKLDPKLPLLLVVDGKGILLKKIDVNAASDVNWLKNLDAESIYYVSYIQQNIQLMSFCRRAVIDEYAYCFQQAGFVLIDHYAGPSCGILLKDEAKKNPFYLNDISVTIGAESLDIRRDKEIAAFEYKVGDNVMDNYTFPLYASAIQYFAQPESIGKSKSAGDPDELVYKRSFSIVGTYILVAFFLMLLASYTAMQFFNGKISDLNLNNLYLGQSFNQIKEMERSKEDKLRILKETGFSSSKFLTFYAYEMARSCPGEIQLTKVDIRPEQKEIKANEKAELLNNLIVVEGETEKEFAFNPWIQQVRNFTWLSNVEIISLKKDKKNVTHFQLKIMLKDV